MSARFPISNRILALALGASITGCMKPAGETASLFRADSTAIADSLRLMVRGAYDLSKGNVVERMMSLYPPSGRVISTTAGRTTTTRDSLEAAVSSFWNGVGQYMVRPTWTFGTMHVDVLDRNSATMSAQYTVPHWTDRGAPHVIGGAWTTVWKRRDGRWMIIHEHLSDMPRALAERLESTMSPIDSTEAAKARASEDAHAH
ncbi:MAG: DUF4440 domain-containing protein [Gemmatimonadaceae bacterium]